MKIKKKNNSIKIVQGGGCLSAFGVLFFIMGLIFFLELFTEHHQQFHDDLTRTILMGCFSVTFMLLGIGMIFGHSYIVVSRDASAIKQYFSMLIRKTTAVFPYDDIETITLKNAEPGDERVKFILQVKGENKALVLVEFSGLPIALETAQYFAEYTGVKLDNQIEYTAPSGGRPTVQSDYNYSKKTTKSLWGKVFNCIFIGVIVYSFTLLDNWSWHRLKEFNNNVVYVEFPESLFTYDQPGLHDFPLSFYQYKPSFSGNHKKHYLELNRDQYQLSLQALDSLSERAVSLVDQKLHIDSVGNYLVEVDVSDAEESQYHFKKDTYDQSAHTLFLQQSRSADKWEPVAKEEVPEELQQKIGLLSEQFSDPKTNSLTKLGNVFYLNKSLHMHVRGVSGGQYYPFFYKNHPGHSIEPTDLIAWKAPPVPIINNFLQSHQGLVFSFGGTGHGSDKEPGNWVYYPEQEQWQELSSTPVINAEDNKHTPEVTAVYSTIEKLFVMVRVHRQDYALYHFDLNAQLQWQLIKQFTMPLTHLNWPTLKWQYLDDNALFSYGQIESNKWPKQTIDPGYIQLLNLQNYQVSTFSTTPTPEYVKGGDIISPTTVPLHIIAYEQKLYGHYAGKYFLKK